VAMRSRVLRGFDDASDEGVEVTNLVLLGSS